MTDIPDGTSEFPFIQDPDAVLDYQVNWSSWLVGDTISTSTFVADTGLTVGATSHTTTTATVWISDGSLNGKYKVVNHITTDGGRENDHTIYFRIREQ